LAKPERLDDRDRHVLDEVADFVCGHTAREISDLSHNAAWQVAAMGETIPYFTAIGLFPAEVTDDDVAWGVDEARRLRPQLSPE
jgi:hypothetical protein